MSKEKNGKIITTKLPILLLPVGVIEARIEGLERDELEMTKTIKDASLTRSSIRGGIIELKRLIIKYKSKENDKTK